MSKKEMTVRGKLTLTFGGITLIVLIVSLMAIKAVNDANSRLTNFVEGVNARALAVAGVSAAVERRGIAARNLVLVSSSDDIQKEKKAVNEAHEDVKNHLSELRKLADNADVTPEARRMILEIEKTEQSYAPIALGIVKLAIDGNKEEASTRIVRDCRPLLEELTKVTEQYANYAAKRSVSIIEHAKSEYETQRNLLAAMSTIAIAIAIAAGLVITRSLTRALGAEPGDLGQVANRVARGDLSPVTGLDRASPESILASLSEMQTGLVNVVARVRDGAEALSLASAEIAQGNQDLSSRTESQASNLEETAASMEELGSTVKQNAENALQANKLAQSASDVAIKGGEVVTQVVETMREINDSSKKIADIISVIDGIAFQTNILALNAAVEAARAGEQGRGFAVVASEVRSLAGRSAEAAKEIKLLISASVEKVAQGSELVDRAGITMTEIVNSIQRVTDIMGEISSASAEQNAGVSQIGEAISQIDQTTQQNAALVEEMAAAADTLKTQAKDLVEAVAVFQLSGHSVNGREAKPSSETTSATPRKATITKPSKPALKLASSNKKPDLRKEEEWETY